METLGVIAHLLLIGVGVVLGAVLVLFIVMGRRYP